MPHTRRIRYIRIDWGFPLGLGAHEVLRTKAAGELVSHL